MSIIAIRGADLSAQKEPSMSPATSTTAVETIRVKFQELREAEATVKILKGEIAEMKALFSRKPARKSKKTNGEKAASPSKRKGLPKAAKKTTDPVVGNGPAEG